MLKNLMIFVVVVITISGCGGSGSSTETPIDTPVTQPDDVTDPVTDPVTDTQPNILFIISDDQGLDASSQYTYSNDLPNTPTIDALATNGITFDNAWATPACTTTRATILTGKYGINSGVTYVPAELSTEHEILQTYLSTNNATKDYQSAVFGKWHLSGGNANASHPNDVGLQHYAGNLSNLTSYYDWSLTVNGVAESSTDYHTTKITDLTIDWVSQQTKPWFAWVAYSAPHSPFHLPPEHLHNRDLSGENDHINSNKRDYYLASIEAMDTEIGRLLDSLSEETRNNTVIIFIGDNGTPKGIIDQTNFDTTHGKGSLYQGGVAVPMIVSGQGVTRVNSRESSLVTATDLYATIADIAGSGVTQLNDSFSFKSTFSNVESSLQTFAYTEFESSDTTGWAVRSQTHKLIQFSNGDKELYALTGNFSETTDLIGSTDSTVIQQIALLSDIGMNITGEGSDQTIDITDVMLTNGSGNCADYVSSYSSNVLDVNNSKMFVGDLMISLSNNKCIFMTNAIPNHDFNDGGNAFPNSVSAQNDEFEITQTPSIASQPTPISLTVDNAILLNGVKVDLLAAGCYNVGNGKIGCNDMNQPWRYDPMHPANGFNVDSHNAHAQPDGTYHYHGSPFALFDDDGSQKSPVIGFAADGFPIFGSYFDDNGTIRKALPSYQLKAGARPTGDGNPGGNYDGAYRDDYEYVSTLGDLDECNGMTVNGVYGYYITDQYPYVLACFTGTADASFNKMN
jgi:arylsulfatase A-like enzyme